MGTRLSEIEARQFDSCSLYSRYNVRLLAEWHCGRILLSAAMGRLRKRLFGTPTRFTPAVAYHGLLVFDREDLNGGGLWSAQEFSRAMLHFGIGKCERIFDFCAGPGYIGYHLFASGYCRSLALADINPEATAVARHTALYNGIEDVVTVYTSDGLDQIPTTEKWDLVVATSPVVPGTEGGSSNLINYDRSGTLQLRFYGSVRKFMKPGGLILAQYTRTDSNPNYFRPMIEAGGGQIVDVFISKDFCGIEGDRYYLLSSW
jgi:hypothetical protein